jgi:hypothetical protein
MNKGQWEKMKLTRMRQKRCGVSTRDMQGYINKSNMWHWNTWKRAFDWKKVSRRLTHVIRRTSLMTCRLQRGT